MATAVENTGPAQHVDPTTGFPKPPIGTVLNRTGTVIIAFTGKYAAGNGSYAAGIGLFVDPANDYHPYVVWTTILHPTGEWVTEAGSYCETIGEAVAEYERRGGKA